MQTFAAASSNDVAKYSSAGPCKRDQNQKPRSTERNSGGGGIFPPLSAVSMECFSDRDVITFENVLPREESYSDDHTVFANGEYFKIIS